VHPGTLSRGQPILNTLLEKGLHSSPIGAPHLGPTHFVETITFQEPYLPVGPTVARRSNENVHPKMDPGPATETETRNEQEQ